MKTLAAIAMLALRFPVFQRLHNDEYPIQKFGLLLSSSQKKITKRQDVSHNLKNSHTLF